MESRQSDLQEAFRTAIAHQKAGRLDAAESTFRQILKARPDHPDALHLLGLMALKAGDVDKAIELIGRAVEIRDDVAPYHFNLAAAHAAREDFGRALRHYRASVRLSPHHPGARTNLGIVLIELGHVQDGIEELRAAIRLQPESAEAHNNLGNALSQTGRTVEAIESYRRATELDPGLASGHDNLGKALLEQGKPAAAVERFERALALAPDDDGIAQRLRQARADQVPHWHFPMVNDTVRNEGYRRAIEAAVDPDSVVLDIGAGTGLLAMIAARAGARRVTTCEMNPEIAATAKEIIARNGLAGSVEVLAMRSTDIIVGRDMAEKANLLIHEIFDNGVLGESVVPTIEHARANLVTSDATVLPRSATVRMAAVESADLYEQFRVREACGFDVRPFNALSSSTLVPARVGDFNCHRLCDPVDLFRFDFAGPPIRPERKRVVTNATSGGTCHALMVWMRIELDEDVTLETAPDGDGSHWMQAIQVLDAPIGLSLGAPLTIDAAHDRLQIHLNLVSSDAQG